jgi:futalosine hydrolase
MKVLIVVATDAEIQGFSDLMERFDPVVPWQIEILVTGAGILATAARLSARLASNKPDLVLNVGIAGAIRRDIALGEVVWVQRDMQYDFGAASPEGWIAAENLGLLDVHHAPYHKGWLQASPIPAPLANEPLRKMDGITVQQVHGDAEGLRELKRRMPHAEVESMEGAAVFYTASLHHVPALQLRAISNYVEIRNRESWKIKEAITALHQTLQAWFINP